MHNGLSYPSTYSAISILQDGLGRPGTLNIPVFTLPELYGMMDLATPVPVTSK